MADSICPIVATYVRMLPSRLELRAQGDVSVAHEVHMHNSFPRLADGQHARGTPLHAIVALSISSAAIQSSYDSRGELVIPRVTEQPNYSEYV